MAAGRNQRGHLEPGDRMVGPGGFVHDFALHPRIRRYRRGRLWSGCADDYFRSLSVAASGPDACLLLSRHAGWQRAWLRIWRKDLRPARLALGILSRDAAGFAACSALLL